MLIILRLNAHLFFYIIIGIVLVCHYTVVIYCGLDQSHGHQLTALAWFSPIGESVLVCLYSTHPSPGYMVISRQLQSGLLLLVSLVWSF